MEKYTNKPAAPIYFFGNSHGSMKAALTKRLYQHLAFIIPAILMVATMLLWVLYDQVDRSYLITWYITFWVVSCSRVALAVWYNRTQNDFHLQGAHYYLFVASTLAIGLLWGIVGSLLMPLYFQQQTLVIVILNGLAVGSLLSLLPSYLICSCYTILIIFPIIVWLYLKIITGNFIYLTLEIAMVMYLVFLLVAGYYGHSFFISNLKLRLENLELLKKFSIAKTNLEQINSDLYASENRFRSSFDFATTGMALISPDGRWLKVNQALCQIVGYSESELLQLDFQAITYPEDVEGDLFQVQELLHNHINSYQLEKRYIGKDGTIIWVMLGMSLVRDQALKPLYFIAQIQSIDAQKKNAEQLKEIAYHDPLTGLPNRKQLELSFNLALAYANRHEDMIAILFLDLDRFKNINDMLGHDAGDILLKTISTRLLSCVRSTDTVARLGGDEFIVLITEITDLSLVIAIVKKIQVFVAEPVSINNQMINITTSIGISVFPRDGDTLDVLLQKADKALYEVKSASRNDYKIVK